MYRKLRLKSIEAQWKIAIFLRYSYKEKGVSFICRTEKNSLLMLYHAMPYNNTWLMIGCLCFIAVTMSHHVYL